MGQCAELDPSRERECGQNIGRDLVLEQSGCRAWLYRRGVLIKDLDLSDPVATRLFVVESVELGANQSRLAAALSISRQTVHNYRQIKRHFGMEGLIRGYSLEQDQRRQRKKYAGPL